MDTTPFGHLDNLIPHLQSLKTVKMNLNRIQWAARRGMLELDLMLQPFVTQVYPRLNADQQALFAELLSCEDQDLFAWLLHRETPCPSHLAPIIERIRLEAATPKG